MLQRIHKVNNSHMYYEIKILIYQQKATVWFLLSQLHLCLVEVCSSYTYLWRQVGTSSWQTKVHEFKEFIVKRRDSQKTWNCRSWLWVWSKHREILPHQRRAGNQALVDQERGPRKRHLRWPTEGRQWVGELTTCK